MGDMENLKKELETMLETIHSTNLSLVVYLEKVGYILPMDLKKEIESVIDRNNILYSYNQLLLKQISDKEKGGVK